MPAHGAAAAPTLDRAEAERRENFDLSLSLCDSWQAMRDQGRARRAALDPLAFGARLLPHLVIVSVLDDGEDFQWRLFGGAHEHEYGVNLAGVKLSELMAENDGLAEVAHIFSACRDTAEPVFYSIGYLNRHRVQRLCNGVILPLFAQGDGAVDHLLGCSQWIDAPA